ncbi:Tagatose-6-phosphate kinase [Jeotgalibaca dankookensis]|uniref:Tagatose-6-phosphate kinase n=1 Tax=Jeotgalibaca dankookensis TaxID=708126 RepID=A0A1S6IS98_9LACT|nr:1-phosphofructokinase [Jeotgalibaca dankookensis]AQS54350.1 Tagatose-6-phosphate kinase [Jeotgalibaca dankookensis]
MIYTVTLNPSIDYIIGVDNLSMGTLNRFESSEMLPGGKGINVSRILKRLNHETIALGFLGGFTGAFIEDSLARESVATKFIKISEPTRINVKIKSNVETELNGNGPHITTQASDQLIDTLRTAHQEDIVILSGSKAANLPENYYQEIIENLTSEFIIDTTGKELRQALAYKPLLVKPNHHELADLFEVTISSEAELMTYGKKLLTKGAQYAIISMAEKGALLFTQDGVYQGSAPKGQVQNSVGAGDSMIAGFAGTYAETADAIAAFRMGLACGSATAFEKDLATAEQIKKLLPEITITKVIRSEEK